LATQKELSLAYSPGVAAPCLEIEKNQENIYQYTNKGNTVAVISNGTAVLGLGNIGASASKPVMEGKAVLFKRFSDIDGIDIEVDTTDVNEFIDAVKHLGPSFGGINLEDIKAPDCFIIEEKLKELMDIPVFHDDQHGTAIAVLAGFINALHVTKKDIKKVKIVCLGAGAAAIACANLLIQYGVKRENFIMLDREGVIHKGRANELNPYKKAFAIETDKRTLEEVIKNADAFIGLSTANVLTKEMVKSMAPDPVIFAMANPNPEIKPELAHEVRPDALIATGRSDYPNQVNNALCFPYIFRGALDVHATEINDAMKIAAAEGIAKLARQGISEEANAAYKGRNLNYGKSYIIPVPFDPRLIESIPPLVAEAAMKTGVAKKPITDLEAYRRELKGRFDPIFSNLDIISERVRQVKKRVVFAEGEEVRAIRAAVSFYNQGLGYPILIGKEKNIQENAASVGIAIPKEIQIHNARLSNHNQDYIEFLYDRLKREGRLLRDCKRYIHQNRNVFGACMVAFGHADAIITGLTRSYPAALRDIRMVFDEDPEAPAFGYSIIVLNKRSLIVADTAIHEKPSGALLANIALRAAKIAEEMGHTPRVAFLSHANFGNPMTHDTQSTQEALKILDQKQVDFEYEGEMSPITALNPRMKEYYPFSRLSGPANILIMPDLNSASISSQLICESAGGNMIGPVLTGFTHAVQIVSMSQTANDMAKIATLAAYKALKLENSSTTE
jgi:malate dehydrogenase (oxaloacetate-decarboxylating)(NADP+)